MKKNFNWKKEKIEDYKYTSTKKQNKYYKNNTYSNKTKIINFNNKKNQILDEEQIEQNNEIPKSPFYLDIENCKSFYPKNYNKFKDEYSNQNNINELYKTSPKNDNEFSNNENSLINESKVLGCKNYSSNEQKIINISEFHLIEEKNEIKDEIKKSQKLGIKSIPHPKRKKGEDESYISKKKILPYQVKNKIEENIIKKERKLSQNNFDSAKHSISTLNSSSSSRQEKNDLNEEKKNINYKNNLSKNKFDNILQKEKYNPNNPCLENIENTEILEVNVKISEQKNITFKIRRFDDLFVTIKLFCEINSISEKLIKPLIIESLKTLNTIYQIYNCNMSSEDISLLRTIENIYKCEI